MTWALHSPARASPVPCPNLSWVQRMLWGENKVFGLSRQGVRESHHTRPFYLTTLCTWLYAVGSESKTRKSIQAMKRRIFVKGSERGNDMTWGTRVLITIIPSTPPAPLSNNQSPARWWWDRQSTAIVQEPAPNSTFHEDARFRRCSPLSTSFLLRYLHLDKCALSFGAYRKEGLGARYITMGLRLIMTGRL